MAGCSTTFTARTRSRRGWRASPTGPHMTTRRWYYLIPAEGQPRGLVHAIERHNLDALPGEKTIYAGRQQLEAGLTRLLAGVTRVAMEYSPNCAIPYLSRVDAGTAEAIRSAGRGDRFVRRSRPTIRGGVDDRLSWPRIDAASDALYRIKDRAFAAAAAGAARPDAADGVRPAAADGALVRGRRAGERFGAGRGHRRKRGQSALPAPSEQSRPIVRGRGAAARPVGKAVRSRVRCLLTSPGWA